MIDILLRNKNAPSYHHSFMLIFSLFIDNFVTSFNVDAFLHFSRQFFKFTQNSICYSRAVLVPKI